jgi:hypothetical protein
MEDKMEPQYLGDGVYASFDGYGINLAVNDHRNHVVTLDPDVLEALERYIQKVKQAVRDQQANLDATP